MLVLLCYCSGPTVVVAVVVVVVVVVVLIGAVIARLIILSEMIRPFSGGDVSLGRHASPSGLV